MPTLQTADNPARRKRSLRFVGRTQKRQLQSLKRAVTIHNKTAHDRIFDFGKTLGIGPISVPAGSSNKVENLKPDQLRGVVQHLDSHGFRYTVGDANAVEGGELVRHPGLIRCGCCAFRLTPAQHTCGELCTDGAHMCDSCERARRYDSKHACRRPPLDGANRWPIFAKKRVFAR